MSTTDLVASTWVNTFPAGDTRFIMTRKPEARSDTALFVRDLWAFTGGTPNAWTPESIKRVTDWRQPFGDDGTGLLAERCSIVVVSCPDVTYRELRTPEFLAAWKQFADDNNVHLRLHYEATFNALMPHDGDEDDMTFGMNEEQELGADKDAIASVVFFTKERYDLVGSTQYWREVLQALQLKGGSYYDPLRQSIDFVAGGKLFTSEDWKYFIDVFEESPERLFGIYDTFWNDALLDGVRHVTVIRFERGVIVEHGTARAPRRASALDEIVGRQIEPETGEPTDVVTGCVFEIEPTDVRGRRHRGGR